MQPINISGFEYLKKYKDQAYLISLTDINIEKTYCNYMHWVCDDDELCLKDCNYNKYCE